MNTGRGTFIALATGPGKTADDNPNGRNGLFTTHLVAALREPGLTIDEVFTRVRERVYQGSAQAQLPWTVSSLIGTFRFRDQSQHGRGVVRCSGQSTGAPRRQQPGYGRTPEPAGSPATSIFRDRRKHANPDGSSGRGGVPARRFSRSDPGVAGSVAFESDGQGRIVLASSRLLPDPPV